MGRKGSLLPALIGVVVVGILLVRYPGVELQAAGEYFNLMPSLIVIIVSIYGAKNSRGVNQEIAFGMVGIGLALMVDALNTLGVWVPTMLITHGLNLQYLQILLIASTMIIGVILNTA